MAAMVDPSIVTIYVIVSTFLGMAFAAFYAYLTAQINISEEGQSLLAHQHSSVQLNDESKAHMHTVQSISSDISEGAQAFLFQEYTYIAYFLGIFGLVLFILLGVCSKGGNPWNSAGFTLISFLTGAITSVVCGYIGMTIATFSNSRTAVSAKSGSFNDPFRCAFKAGCVMGFSLVSIGVFILFIIVKAYKSNFDNAYVNIEDTKRMFECIAGYGLGGSSVALFGRVGGGIYTKAADVGADLCKIEYKFNEDSPQNPAVIADNVGDNVGDIAGMGADLFGSFAESSCAAMVIAAQSPDLFKDFTAICFPLIISSAGILVCIVTSFVATHIQSVNQKEDIEKVLKYQLVVSTVLMTPVAYALCYGYLPATFSVAGTSNVKNYQIFFCLLIGLWSGLIIGYTTEYYTSNAYSPVQEVADSCRTGAATNVIYGLALGYKSVIVPVFCISLTIYVGFKMADMYGVAMGALGILSTLSIGLTIDAYGPICDNAGGVAEMAGLDPEVRDITDALDAAGNTTAAIGKGFAIGSAALVSLALFGAFVTTVGLQKTDVSVLNPLIFAGALIGAMLPYWFSALTMKSVGIAAKDMVLEVGRQFAEKPALRDINHPDHKTTKPDYKTCVAISTKAALKEMMAPGALVMLSPILMGFLIGVDALAGMLVGALISGVQVAISASNTGGAWDNAKKFIENADNDPESDPSKRTFGKGKPMHAAAVIGDTIGDPLKDTSGPSLNILIKLMAIISLVFGPAFPSLKDGGYLFQLFNL